MTWYNTTNYLLWPNFEIGLFNLSIKKWGLIYKMNRVPSAMDFPPINMRTQYIVYMTMIAMWPVFFSSSFYIVQIQRHTFNWTFSKFFLVRKKKHTQTTNKQNIIWATEKKTNQVESLAVGFLHMHIENVCWHSNVSNDRALNIFI